MQEQRSQKHQELIKEAEARAKYENAYLQMDMVNKINKK